MDIIKEIIKIFLVVALIFFILNNAIKNFKVKNKLWVNLFTGLLMTGLFVVAFFVDRHRQPNVRNLSNLLYIGIGFIYTVAVSIYFFVRGYGSAMLPSRHLESNFYYKDILYLLYRSGNSLYLRKDKSGYYSGAVVKVKKSQFLEDVLNDVNKKYNFIVNSESMSNIGKLTLTNKKIIYHCYSIELLKEPTEKKWEKINA